MPEPEYRLGFTMYMPPNGGKSHVYTVVSGPEADMARALGRAGAEFDIEVLSTGEVSMTVEMEREDGTEVFAIEICDNTDEAVPAAVTKLINTAYLQMMREEAKWHA